MDKIKRFSILKVGMKGFKRFKESYVAEFDKVTYISGGNGSAGCFCG